MARDGRIHPRAVFRVLLPPRVILTAIAHWQLKHTDFVTIHVDSDPRRHRRAMHGIRSWVIEYEVILSLGLLRAYCSRPPQGHGTGTRQSQGSISSSPPREINCRAVGMLNGRHCAIREAPVTVGMPSRTRCGERMGTRNAGSLSAISVSESCRLNTCKPRSRALLDGVVQRSALLLLYCFRGLVVES
jgi:hypothetical protein